MKKMAFVLVVLAAFAFVTTFSGTVHNQADLMPPSTNTSTTTL